MRDFEALMSELRTYQLNRELRKAIQTMLRCRHEIYQTMKYRLSNGPIEGCNHKIKTTKRVLYGYRSFDNFTNHIRIQFLLTYRQPIVFEEVLYLKPIKGYMHKNNLSAILVSFSTALCTSYSYDGYR